MDADKRIESPLGCFEQIAKSKVKTSAKESLSPAPSVSRPSRSSSPAPSVSLKPSGSSTVGSSLDALSVSSPLTSLTSQDDGDWQVCQTEDDDASSESSGQDIGICREIIAEVHALDDGPIERFALQVTSQEQDSEISINNVQVRKIKIATANTVEQLINKMSVKVSTESDIKLLVDAIYERDALIAQQNLASEETRLANKKLEAKVALLTKSEDKMASVLVEQRKLITSTLSLNSREKRLKLASRHSVTFLSTKTDNLGMKVRNCLAQVPPAEVATVNDSQIEVVQSDISVNQEMYKKQKEMSRMVGIVENLSNKYSPKFARYGKFSPTNHSTRRKGRPAIVPKVFSAIWRLLLKPPPPVKRIQDLTPQVNLSGINFNLKKNLPRPSYYPLKGVSQNAEMYSSTSYRDNMERLVVKPAAFAERELPFGGFQGLKTDLGIIAMPSQIVHGFVWSQEEQEWVIAATREKIKKRD